MTKTTETIQRPPAEQLYANELARLVHNDVKAAKPDGWRMSPKSVLAFVLGDARSEIQPKFVGSRSLVERTIVGLASNRAVMLIGDPGTAKSYLSELLTAAISGDSTLVVQGSAGATEDTIKYSWNYALLLAEGPSQRALVAAPVLRGMREGRIVRFEEITRCPLEIQDALLSILSERMMAVPELPASEDRNVFARTGFNVIATANTRDRGVNEMSAALKRRFNFETIPPIENLSQELELVKRETDRMLAQAGIQASLPADIAELLVTTFHDLRTGKTVEGATVSTLASVMSTAEAVSVAFASMVHAHYYEQGDVRPEHLVQSLIGSALKDATDDAAKLRHYFNHAVQARSGPRWREYYEARHLLP
jgi:MoxR-like ATPase